MKDHFRASWDTKLKVLTSFFVLLLVLIMFSDPRAALLSSLVLFGSFCFGVRGYSVDEDTLLIHRLGWATKYDLTKLTDIEFDPGAIIGSIRTWGIGGLFGYIGYFRNSTIGNYKAYATNDEHSVILEIDNRKIVLTPDSPEEFIETVRSAQNE